MVSKGNVGAIVNSLSSWGGWTGVCSSSDSSSGGGLSVVLLPAVVWVKVLGCLGDVRQ